MTGNEVREKYLKFFEKRGHKIISPAPLVLKDDSTTLFTSSGMQPLVTYLMGEKYPDGSTRLVDSQPSIRAQDIEEVGDNRHTTFFEMLGNWSLGDYFKKEQLPWIWEFITKELKLPKERLYVSIFEGNDEVNEDTESLEIWKSLGLPEDHIYKYGVKKNWWSRAGTPEQMPIGEIGGCDSEIFFEFENVKHDLKFGEKCHPNCDCGRYLEIGNSVFMQYKKTEKGLEELPNKNVDFGGGLERLTAATNNDPDVFKTDLFSGIIKKIEEISSLPYLGNEKNMRIIADHVRASCFLIADGVVPFKEGHGSVLRRLIRGSINACRSLNINHSILSTFAEEIIIKYPDFKNLQKNKTRISQELSWEEEKYSREVLSQKVLSKAQQLERPEYVGKEYPENMVRGSAIIAFNSLATLGVPASISMAYAKNAGTITVNDEPEWQEVFNEQKQQHQELSRKSSEGKFKIK